MMTRELHCYLVLVFGAAETFLLRTKVRGMAKLPYHILRMKVLYDYTLTRT